MNINSPLPLRCDYHVVWNQNTRLWCVKQEHRDEFSYSYRISKDEALGLAIEQARQGQVSVIIHGMDGRIQDVRSYDGWVGPRE